MEQNRTYSRGFDERYAYDGKDLGAVCREGRTVFKVWSPMAERVQLRLYRGGSSRAWLRKAMQPGERGVWTLEFPESLHGMYYDYIVHAEGKSRRTADPYAVGCCCNGGRSMVVDLGRTDPPGFEADAAPGSAGSGSFTSCTSRISPMTRTAGCRSGIGGNIRHSRWRVRAWRI